jgi:hypothetical protein
MIRPDSSRADLISGARAAIEGCSYHRGIPIEVMTGRSRQAPSGRGDHETVARPSRDNVQVMVKDLLSSRLAIGHEQVDPLARHSR